MYKVIIINNGTETIIHYPTTDKQAPHLLKMDLKEKAGQAQQFNFTIPFTNQGYNEIFDLTTLIQIIKNGNEIIFEGRVFSSVQNVDSNGDFYKEVVCESEISYLNDTRTRAWDIKDMSTSDFITLVINNHNSHTTVDKYFQVGNIEVLGNITCKTSFENSLNILIDKVVNSLEVGYLIVRKENNIRYLDYLPQLGGVSADIVLGKNMKDISFTKDATNIATRLIPVGKDNLTISSVNGGVDYLEDITAINEFGIIEQTLELKDIDDATTLKTQAQSKLDNMSKAIYKLSTNILDLSTINLDPFSYYVGSDTNIKCQIINFNETFTIIEKNTDLLNPQNCKIVVDDKFETMTDRQISLERISKYVEKILTADKQVNTFYLDGYIDLLKNQMGAMADAAEKQLAKAILFEDTIPGSPTFGAMALGTQGFLIADNIVNGDWDWRTFGTGKGFAADLIVAGHLLGGAVDFNLNAGTLKISHTDTTYSLLSADGIKRFIDGVEYNYIYLAYTGAAIIPDSSNSITIQLPDRFKNRNFSAIAQAASLQNLTDGYALKTYEVFVSGYDYANARISIDGTCIATTINTPITTTQIDFQITFMVMGG